MYLSREFLSHPAKGGCWVSLCLYTFVLRISNWCIYTAGGTTTLPKPAEKKANQPSTPVTGGRSAPILLSDDEEVSFNGHSMSMSTGKSSTRSKRSSITIESFNTAPGAPMSLSSGRSLQGSPRQPKNPTTTTTTTPSNRNRPLFCTPAAPSSSQSTPSRRPRSTTEKKTTSSVISHHRRTELTTTRITKVTSTTASSTTKSKKNKSKSSQTPGQSKLSPIEILD